MQVQSSEIGQLFMAFQEADHLVSKLALAQVEENIVWTKEDIEHAMRETGCVFSIDDLKFKYAQLTQPEYVMAQKAVSIALSYFDPNSASAQSTLNALVKHRNMLHNELAKKFPGLTLYAASLPQT